ncbi:Clavaminate synthase-like protein [Delitschia confertaspora ATCC 74209]|uniref:Clavaminate synthase-like protein n=1 Tax=Delitschia confertaspora ATCC 74209 TaxID=1513339 RepID=A0A9P4JC91_9PLEO|nr:Clavaminate synthase-like protein [Delitschia confertaspora ATCC 74209]
MSASGASAEIELIQQITALTDMELTLDDPNFDDPVYECGMPVLMLLQQHPELCIEFAYQKLHDRPYKEVPESYRRLYTEAALKSVNLKLKELQKEKQDEEERRQKDEKKDWISEVVAILDKAYILTGAPLRENAINAMFRHIQAFLSSRDAISAQLDDFDHPPKKRIKISSAAFKSPLDVPAKFLSSNDTQRPQLRYPMKRIKAPSFEDFQNTISASQTPFIVTGAISNWPAMSTERSWNSPLYLLEQTLGGRRLVPVEVGRSYTDDGWGQKLITFGEFMNRYMLNDRPLTSNGYLAQHDLLSQIPPLRSDITIPDYCYTSPPPPPPNIKPPPAELEEPILNAWFGPKGTISPLHTDPYHNILAQVVGFKYVRLYAPSETPNLHPRSIEDNGVDMSNTSSIDLDHAIALFPEIGNAASSGGEEGKAEIDDAEMLRLRKEFEEEYPGFRDAEYVEGVLGPGECLYLPVGWWHYVKSLTPSFSVSFWWC